MTLSGSVSGVTVAKLGFYPEMVSSTLANNAINERCVTRWLNMKEDIHCILPYPTTNDF